MTLVRICAGPMCGNEFEPHVHNQSYCSYQCKQNAKNQARRVTPLVTRPERSVTTYQSEPLYSADEEEDEGRNEFLRKENLRLGRLADKNKQVKAELVDATYQAAFDAFSDISMPLIPVPDLSYGPGEEEVAVAVLSDWQLGKVTPSYNSDICRDRINLYADKIVRITNIQRADHPVRRLHMWLLGDIVEGEDIFQGQTWLVDSSLYRQVGINGPEIIRDFILKMLDNFETIHFTGVIGNHGSIGGRGRKEYNSETNMDRLLYKIIELMFAYEPRVTFSIPDGDGERNFYAVDTIGDYGTLLLHGDQFGPPSSTHSYYKKVMGWKDGAIPERFDDVFMGHYHQNAKMTLGSSTLRVSGSPESYNTFAQEVLGVMGRPSQHMQFIHPRVGVTAEHTIYLDV